jgi:class 3 adenylate cyclase/pimeloyl-ACP methyl ester carboxylesterase
MIEPQVRYATTSDGVAIAYWSIGEGPAIVMPPPSPPFSHITEEWQIPEWRHWYEHLAEHFQIVRYDGRGSGLSDREGIEFSTENSNRDLDAVVDALRLDRFALFAIYWSSLLVLPYAARNQDRVSHLILWCGMARSEDGQTAQTQSLELLRDTSWELFTETLSHTVFGWSEGERAHRFAEYMRAATTAELCSACWESQDKLDLRPLLSEIHTPTLVMHRRHFALVPLAAARELAGMLPNARLAVLEGNSVAPYVGDIETPMQIIAEFLGADPSAFTGIEHQRGQRGAFRTIMFTDIEGSTAATTRLGDAQAQEILRAHNKVVRDALHAHAGTEVKHTGDGIMASFNSATDALEAAIAIQRGMAAQEGESASNVRIGINAGEPLVEGNDLFGTAVQLASRVCTRAEPQQILVADVVRQLVAGKGFLFADRGDTDLRGFEEPVRLYEVRWRE